MYSARSVFLAVDAILCWLDNVSGVYLVTVTLLLSGQQGLGKEDIREQPTSRNLSATATRVL